MKKNLFIQKLSVLLLLFPALSFAQGTVSGPTSCYPYVGSAPSPNTYTYTLSYTPPSGYTLDGISWYFSESNYQAAIYDANGKATTMKVGWRNTDCLLDGKATAYVRYKKVGQPDLNITTAALTVKILCLKTPTSMTGTFSVPCNNNTAITYCVPPVTNATSYEWTYPAGWQPSGAVNGYCITLIPTLLTPGTTSAQICVRAKNAAQGLFSIWFCKTISPRAPTIAPSFISPTLNICAVTLPGSAEYNITTVSGAASYSWGGTDFGRIPPTETNATAYFWHAGIHTITAEAVNACGTGPSSLINVKVSTSGPAQPGPVYYEREGNGNGNTNSCYYSPFVSAISGAFSYDWSLDNFSSYCTSTLPDDVECMLLMPNTTYAVSVRANNSCGSSSYSTTTKNTPSAPLGCIWKTTSVSSQTAEYKESYIYPNPAHTSFEISLPDNENFVKIKMINMEGKVIKDFSTDKSKIIVQTSDIPAGLYLINITSDNLNTVNKIQIVK